MKSLVVAVIGAGSTYTPEMVEGFIRRKSTLPLSEIRFMDINREKLEIVCGLAKRMLEDSAGVDGSKAKILLTQSLEEALSGADFVLTQIRVGGLEARIKDEKIPLKYGLIGQETTGIGGFMKAMRTIPVLLHIAKTMEKLCPDAFLINFTNPAGVVTEALLGNSTIKSIGLCNAPYHMIKQTKSRLPESARTVEIGYLGLNHLSWITSAIADGVDYLPDQLSGRYSLYKPKNNPDMDFSSDLLQTVGGIPSSYLHYFYNRTEMLDKLLHTEKSRGEVCQDIERELLELYKDPNLKEKPAILEQRGGAYYSEVAVSLIDAIANDRNEVHVVNTRNAGALEFMDTNDVVEVPCRVGKRGLTPIPIRGFSNDHMIGLMRTLKVFERHTVAASIEGSRSEALLALVAHPLVGDWKVASACLEEMLEANKPYVGRFF